MQADLAEPNSQEGQRSQSAIVAYVDDSMESNRVLILAGYISSTQSWEALSDEWRALLSYGPSWEYFSMREVMARAKLYPEVAERAGWFYRAIERNCTSYIVLAIDLSLLQECNDELGLSEKPYDLAFRMLSMELHRALHEQGYTGTIDCIFDQRSEFRNVIDGFRVAKRFNSASFGQRIGNLPQFGDDKVTLPLQAADLLAGSARQHWLKNGSLLAPPLALPWPTHRELPFLVLEPNRYDLMKHLYPIAVALKREAIYPTSYFVMVFVHFHFNTELEDS